MGWFNNLVETYDRLSGIVGIPDEAGNVLLPQNHMAMNTDICVTIDGDGNFRRAAQEKQNIVIPCTEDSSSRTSGAAAHPLHEQLGYILLNDKKRALYLKQLADWSGRHPKAAAVNKYVLKNTLLSDLRQCGIAVDVEPEKLEKLFIRFAVEIPKDQTPCLWEDKTVAAVWQAYCAETQSGDEALCYATGKRAAVTTKHPKGVNPATNGAKLISYNDLSNYTFRGRFTAPDETNAISAVASHKAHAALRYLIATQSYRCDTQAIVAWAIDEAPKIEEIFEDTLGIFAAAIQSDREALIEAQTGGVAIDYAKKWRSALSGMGSAGALRNTGRQIAVIAVDAATTGRMGVTFYQDLQENEYIERIEAWHESCRWYQRYKGKEYISAPSADRIIAVVYGEPKGESYNKIKKQARERLLHNMICEHPLDRSWIASAIHRVSAPFSYDKKDGGWDKYRWENAVNVACSLIKKYYSDRKEEFGLELDKKQEDRSYLYGRLLAIADRLEDHARWKQTGKNDTDKRATNAVRYMSAFSAKPYRTWNLIYKQLSPYIQILKGAGWYQKQIDEIMNLFQSVEDYANDRPLDGKYLLGYSLQRRELYANVKEGNTNEFDEED